MNRLASCGLGLLSIFCVFPARLWCQTQIRPRLTVSGECTALAWAPDGRLAYSLRHILQTRKLDIERDDVWVLENDGTRHQIFAGEKLTHQAGTFSFTITRLRWSPDSSRIAAELHAIQIPSVRGDEQDSQLLLLLDAQGKELRIEGGDAIIGRAADGTWLAEPGTLAYSSGSGRGSPLFILHVLRTPSARGSDIFVGHTFASVAWDSAHNAAIAVERSSVLSSAARLIWLDLLHEDGRALATIEGYAGGLALSPTARRAAYFLDAQTMEVRDLDKPQRAARLRCDFGQILWSSDETRLLVKHGPERREGDLVWMALPELAEGDDPPVEAPPDQSFLTGVLFRDAAISPDGKLVGLIEAGNRNLLVYELR
jgi:hypothetical protein